MTRPVFGADAEVKAYVETRLGLAVGEGVAIGVEDSGELIAGVIYHNATSDPSTGEMRGIEMSIASDHPRWCTRETLDAFFGYPFRQLGVDRVQAIAHRKNRHTRKFLERLGFVYEGMGRKAWPTGGDAAAYSMLANECRWLKHG